MGGDERTALYRLYDAKARLLYVGIAVDPEERWRQHSRSKRATWWPSVERKTVKWYPDRAAADAAETRVINGENPLHNHAKREDTFTCTFYETGAEIKVGVEASASFSVQAADVLRAELLRGVHRSGSRMPSGQDLQDRFKVNIQTIYKALRSLANEGLLEKRAPRGPYYVA